MRRRLARLGVPLSLATVVLAAPAAHGARDYRATIERTTGGVPHITARTYGDLGFGYGHAYAEDQLCTLADSIVTVNAERSRYFGADNGYGTPTQINNLKSDFFFARVKDSKVVERQIRRPFPHGPRPEVRQMVRGWVAGYNRYLRHTGRSRLPDPRCRGKAWVRPITELDMYRYVHRFSLRASSGNFLNEIVDAAPPAATAAAAGAGRLPTAEALRRGLADDPVLGDTPQLGSNGWGVGRAMTRSKRGLVFANPHFPEAGPDRWYELHLTIPGKLDVTGAALQAVPAVNLGFNRNVAWTHTVSTARRFTPYELQLVPGKPTTYRYEGAEVPMTRRTVTVALGGGRTASHTFYETRWGPVLQAPSALLTWTAQNAYALADVNWGNMRILNQWFEYDHARSVRDLVRANNRVQGNPWTNTIAADRSGLALYADDTVVPNVSKALMARCSTSPKAPLLLAGGGVVLLDGSRAACAWGTDKDAVAKGILGPRNLPRVIRADYALNANSSHWLPNARVRLEGYAPILGPERTARSLRTRLNLLEAEDARRRGGLTVKRMRDIAFNSRVHSAELARDAVVAACGARPELADACRVLAAWDRQADVDSRGMHLWREFWSRLAAASGIVWRTPFDAEDALRTPGTLDAGGPAVLTALSGAVADLTARGIALDARFGDLQYERRGGRRHPMHGCTDLEGCLSVLTPQRDERTGHYDPYTGNSFVMVAEFDRRGRPHGEAVLRYSQSENPRSRHSADQTALYAKKRWLKMRFTRKEIRRDGAYTRRVVRGRG